MPIQRQSVTPSQFDWLQANITEQVSQITGSSTLAQSGLQYIVDLSAAAPEIDLVNPFAAHLGVVEGLDLDANFYSVVTSLNAHVVSRGTTLLPGDSSSDRLNRWLAGQEQLIPDGSGGVMPDPAPTPVLVTTTFARLSSGAGFFIDPCNVTPGGVCPDF
jgi:hypothetical protein